MPPDAIVFFSTNSGPKPINHALSVTLTEDHVYEMIGQSMDNFAKKQWQENEQFQLSMQNTNNNQYSNLSVVIL